MLRLDPDAFEDSGLVVLHNPLEMDGDTLFAIGQFEGAVIGEGEVIGAFVADNGAVIGTL